MPVSRRSKWIKGGAQWVRVVGDIAVITLASDKGEAIVDAIDADLVGKFKWFLHKCGNARRGSYATTQGEDGKKLSLHHLIFGKPNPGTEVDHKNGNGLDCRRDNLRLGTHAQNAANTPNRKPGSSRFRGVMAMRRGDSWRACISDKHLGVFRSEVEAAKAYDAAATVRYGEFANLNFPCEVRS